MTKPDPFAPIGRDDKTPSAANRKALVVAMPVPADAPKPPADHFSLGKPTGTWTYPDAAGALLGFTLRFDTGSGEKEFRPLTLWRDVSSVKLQWRWQSWPKPRPLYGLRALANRPNARVVVVEGEKSADAAAQLLASCVVVTSPGGNAAAAKTDWSPLRGRDVTVWPDADSAGLEYARAVAECVTVAGATSVAIVAPPTNVKVKWDAANALEEGWSGAAAGKLIAAAEPFQRQADRKSKGHTAGGDAAHSGGGRRRTPQRDTLIGLTENCQLWHDLDRIAYATIPVNEHHEHWPIRSRDFRMWLSGRFYEATGSAIGGQAIEDGIRILEAQAVNENPQYERFIRVGRSGGNLYLDLCNNKWEVVEITPDGSSVVQRPAVKLLRSSSMRPLPEPERGGLIEELRGFLNMGDDEATLTEAWLVAALRDRGPYPILILNGEQGSGKSLVSRMLRSLVDPSAAPIRAIPQNDRDLVVAARNSWTLIFDNLSGMPAWFADALCRLATGSGFGTRALHTDYDEIIFDAARPIVLNGIPSLTDRPDLADRAITAHLVTIPEDQRTSEEELIAAFEAKRPIILGALLDAVSTALRNIKSVRLERSPRMADFVKWSVAAAPGLGWEPDQFLAAYRENGKNVSESAFEADPVAVAIRDLVINHHSEDGVTCTPTELLVLLNGVASEGVRKSRLWPLSAQALGNRVDRIAPVLRNKGFVVERRHGGARHIIIKAPARADAS
jgi:putative DNA primase/helicase